MAEQRISNEPVRTQPASAVPPSTVIVTDRAERSGSGVGWIVAIVVLLAVLVAIWAFVGRSQQSDMMKDNAITQAADKVGDAAGKVGDAASNVGTAAKNTADKAADSAGSVTVTTGSSDQSDGSQD